LRHGAGRRKKVTYDLLVWAGGIRGNSLLAKNGFQVDAKGRVAIDEYCALQGRDRVFSLGDCAVYTDQASGRAAPWLAQTAIEQGYILASKILSEISGTEARAYKLNPYPTVLPMGGKNALFVYKNFFADGFLGWLLHEAASLRYFVSVLRLWEGFKLWLRGAWVYSKND
jgi:NADH dehydrogenase